MNKKIVFIFSVFFIFTLFIVITMIGIVPADFDDRKGSKELIFYYYEKSNPQEVNYNIVRYLLEPDREKLKDLSQEDISGFTPLTSTEIKFYDTDKNGKSKKTKKGTTKRIFIFSNPYYAIFDGFKIEINKTGKLGDSQYHVQNINEIPNRTFETDEFSFVLKDAQVRGRSSKNTVVNYQYLEIKQKKEFTPESNENYEIKITDIYYSAANKKLFVDTKKEVFD